MYVHTDMCNVARGRGKDRTSAPEVQKDPTVLRCYSMRAKSSVAYKAYERRTLNGHQVHPTAVLR